MGRGVVQQTLNRIRNYLKDKRHSLHQWWNRRQTSPPMHCENKLASNPPLNCLENGCRASIREFPPVAREFVFKVLTALGFLDNWYALFNPQEFSMLPRMDSNCSELNSCWSFSPTEWHRFKWLSNVFSIFSFNTNSCWTSLFSFLWSFSKVSTSCKIIKKMPS